MSHRLTIQEPKSISAYKEKTPGKKSFKIEDAGLPFEDVRQREADFKRCCNSITAEEIKEIKDCFDLFDSAKTGTLTFHEAKVAVRSLGRPITKMEVGMLMSKRASKEEGLDYPTFLCFMVDGGTYKSAKEDRIRYGFQLFDDQSTGRITHKGLTRIFKDVGMGYNDAIIEAMIDCFDRDQDGAITEGEFKFIMEQDAFGGTK